MDCDLARILQLFPRPGDLTAADAAALAAHLESCPACSARVAEAGRFDRAVTLAMPALAVPAGGRAGAVARVARLHQSAVRRRLAAGVGVAAGVLLAVGVGLGVAGQARPAADTLAYAYEAERVLESPEAAVRAYFRGEGVADDFPAGFDFALYSTHARFPVLGTSAPGVMFVRRPPGNGPPERAVVVALTRSRFDLRGVAPAQASFYNVTPLRGPRNPDVVWLVLHTTPDIGPFWKDPRREG